MRTKHIVLTAGLVAGALSCGEAQALVISTTSDGSALLSALVPNTSQFSSIVASYALGDASQVGTYSGFDAGPVTMPNGVVLSTGKAGETTAAFHSINGSPDTVFNGGSTPEIDAYAPDHVTNWLNSHDTAKLNLDFSLASAAAIKFNFSFGSVEYPVFTNNFTDAFYAFLDGKQISFDSKGSPVQVGSSFSTTLTTADVNTAFSDPHGLIGNLTTTSGTLLAGEHLLSFEVADTNDGALDSAVFLTGFGTTTNSGGPTTGPVSAVPLPATLPMFGAALLVLGAVGYGANRRGKTGIATLAT